LGTRGRGKEEEREKEERETGMIEQWQEGVEGAV
jgi:hypothetical protein